MTPAEIEAIRARAAQPFSGNPSRGDASGVSARHSSETNEHYTPARIVEAARKTMGGIDLDPASCLAANESVRAENFFDVKTNGFGRPWFGRVFLNPPGGACDAYGVSVRRHKDAKGYFYDDGMSCKTGTQSSAKAWWFKLAREFRDGRVKQAIFVGFSLEILQVTQVQPPDDLPPVAAFPLCIPTRRIAYLTPKGGTIAVGASPPHGSVLAYLGPRVDAFAAQFAPIGRVINCAVQS